MQCAAEQRCKLPESTPSPPSYTIHGCRKCGGYLYGNVRRARPRERQRVQTCELRGVRTCGTATGGEGKGTTRPARTTPLSSPNGGSSNAKAGDGGKNAGAPSKKLGEGQKRSNYDAEHEGGRARPPQQKDEVRCRGGKFWHR